MRLIQAAHTRAPSIGISHFRYHYNILNFLVNSQDFTSRDSRLSSALGKKHNAKEDKNVFILDILDFLLYNGGSVCSTGNYDRNCYYFYFSRRFIMILSCHQITYVIGEQEILDQISFSLEDHEKAAIIGINGAGKTTLLRILAGEISPEAGTFTLGKDKSVGYLAQYQDITSDETIYDSVMSVRQDLLDIYTELRRMEQRMKDTSGKELESLLSSYDRLNLRFEQENGYALQSEVTGVLKGLGFSQEEFGKKVSTLSGGQRTRVCLGRLLLAKPDLLMLDEPTNHLDMESVAWLENYLSGYSGAVIIVAHDRYFIDKVASRILEIENHRLTVYKGGYADYAREKAVMQASQEKAYENQQREIRRQEEVIRKLKSFNREKSIKRAESREKQLAKIQRIPSPVHIKDNMGLKLVANMESGNDVLFVQELAKSYTAEPLFKDLDFEIKKGERVAIIGANGTGKTTILKIINGIVPPDWGMVKTGTNVHIGYYDQEQQVLEMDKTIFQAISDRWPAMTHTRIRNVLASFLFTGEDVFKEIGSLSGGERARVSLAMLMLSGANFLILDEPTNHLDIISREILEQAISAYNGTLLYVSHDRYFINQTATRILELADGKLTSYLGNYDDYLERKQIQAAAQSMSSPAADSTVSQAAVNAGSLDNRKSAAVFPEQWSSSSSAPAGAISSSEGKQQYLQRKEEIARERKRENTLKKTIARIDEIDARQTQIDELLAQEEIYTDHEKLLALSEEKEKLEEEQLELMELWESLEG